MKPTKQTILHDPENGKHGNCLSAVLASLLHLPIEVVPVFSNPDTWLRDLNLWLRPKGLAFLQISFPDGWLAQCGVEGCYHEVSGGSPRSNDVCHACVGVDGTVVFDPHPDNTKLVGTLVHGMFVALRPWEVSRTNTELDVTFSL